MIHSLHAHQTDRIRELGAWRDEGRLFEVGKDGEVGKYHEDQKENSDGHSRKGAAGRQGASGPRGPEASSESAGQDGLSEVRGRYLEAMTEVRDFYPDLRVLAIDDGIWLVTQIFPIGRDGPSFSVCLFLPDSKAFDPKGFAFVGGGVRAKVVGYRHTNFPDASICSHIRSDNVWWPGDSPLILLNLYAEWLLCHLYLRVEKRWPGPQAGVDAVYRQTEFKDDEWCGCDSQLRYGQCHKARDLGEVQLLKLSGEYSPIGERRVPQSVIDFAKSRWKMVPPTVTLSLFGFQDDRAMVQSLLERARA